MTYSSLIHTLTTSPAALPLAEDIVLEDYAQNCVLHGRAEAINLFEAFFRGGFSNPWIELRTVLSDEESVMFEFLFNGRQDGAFLGLPVTRREVTLPMVIVCQLRQNQVWRAALYYDAGTLLRQLGLAL